MNFRDMSNTDQYLAGTGVVVYLESTDDVFVFKKWFGELLSKIAFKSISGERANGGCTQVIERVKNNNQNFNNEKTYGIVDRDALLGRINNDDPDKARYEEAWWHINDTDFINLSPFGDKIFVLTRWELENYLLDPKVLRKFIEDATMGDISFSSDEELASKILETEQDLILVTLFSILKGSGGDGRFERVSDIQLKEEIKKALPITGSKLDQYFEKVLCFSEGIEDDSIKRWNRLSRMLDGKRVMKRLDSLLINRKVILNEKKGFLANNVANLGLIDSHLKKWLESIN